MTKNEPNPLRRRRRIRQLVGALVCILVLIGIGTIISGGVKTVLKLTDDTAERAEFEKRIMNLVPYDPVPFDSLAEANQNVLLSASIWGTLSDIDQTVLERDDIGQPFLPTVDVDRWASQLFGPDYKFEHATFEDHGVYYTYVEEKQAYLIPITGAMMDYTPKVVKLKKEGKTKRVTVGYISPFLPSGEYNTTGVAEPVKYLDYIFTKNEKNYYLSAITDSEMKAPENLAPVSSSPASEFFDPNAFITENASSTAIAQDNSAVDAEPQDTSTSDSQAE